MKALPCAAAADFPRERASLRDYVELTKARIAVLVVATVAVGAFAAARGAADPLTLLHVAAGTALLAAGSSVLNQLIERDTDAKMVRTESRPVVTGRVSAREALVLGVMLASAGAAWLFLGVNVLSGALGVATLALYVGAYTPLKTRTPLCTIVGAVPGAMPPLIGWAAVAGRLEPEAFLLFATVFLWQFPHFLAIAWMYRDDYGRAGLAIITTRDATGAMTARQMLAYGLVLVPVSVAPALAGLAGPIYFAGTLAASVLFLTLSCAFALRATRARARVCLYGSLVYLPVVLTLLMVDLRV